MIIWFLGIFALFSILLSYVSSIPFVLVFVAYVLPNILEIICLLYIDKLVEKKIFVLKILAIPICTVILTQLMVYYEIDSYRLFICAKFFFT